MAVPLEMQLLSLWEGAGDGWSVYSPAVNTEWKDGVLSPRLQPGPTFAVVNTGRVKMEAFKLALSLLLPFK